jgi:hypothetical protein
MISKTTTVCPQGCFLAPLVLTLCFFPARRRCAEDVFADTFVTPGRESTLQTPELEDEAYNETDDLAARHRADMNDADSSATIPAPADEDEDEEVM